MPKRVSWKTNLLFHMVHRIRGCEYFCIWPAVYIFIDRKGNGRITDLKAFYTVRMFLAYNDYPEDNLALDS